MAMRFFKRAVFGLCGALALAVPALPHQAPYVPPSGWVLAPAPAGFVGKWVKPGDDTYRQNVSIVGHRFTGSLDDFYTIAIQQLRKEFPGGNIAVNEDTTVCVDNPAKYVSYALNTNDGAMIIEQIITVENGAAYILTYARLASQESDHAARQSMTTLCGV